MVDSKFTLSKAIKLIEIATNKKLDILKIPSKSFSGVAVDSRLVQPGNLFFALPGKKTDGHMHLEQAAGAGAAAAIVSKTYAGENFGLPLIKVENGLDALQGMAKQLLSLHSPRIIAITGSLGKTTTKDFISTLLQQKYRVGASPCNSNSQIGLPLAIINHITPKDEILVLEMGMTEPGNIANLVKIAPPDIAVITAIEMVHIAYFDSLEHIARTKAEIFSHPKTALGIISRDIVAFDEIKKMGSCRKLSFSTKNDIADYFLEEKADHLRIHEHDAVLRFPLLQVPGKHNLHNFLAAVAVARNMHLTRDEILHGMNKLKLPEKRMQRIEKNGVIFINDSYNASAASIKAALESLPKPKSGRKTVAVIGEMKDLGKHSDACHREVAEAALNCVDQMLCYGEGCKPIVEVWKGAKHPVEYFSDFTKLTDAVWKSVHPGDVVLLKGSNANMLWRILE